MQIKINNHNINYIQEGKGKDILLLHGWGQNIEMMLPLGNQFKNKFRITILDLPGFGKSEEPQEEWDIHTYTNIIRQFIQELKIVNPILIGHSFGGRIAIDYTAHNKVNKLVLFGSPCIRDKDKLTYKEQALKTIAKIPGIKKIADEAKKYIGSPDYRQASPMMRKILVNVINEDLFVAAKKINVPTLLIWGTEDQASPIEEAIELEKIIQDSALIKIDGGTHYVYLEALNYVTTILKEFL